MATNANPAGGPAYLAEDYSWFPIRCSIAAIVMSTTAYILRFWARTLQAAPWGWFDWFMIPAYIFTIAMSICGILAAEWGSGRHVDLLYRGPDADFDRWGLLTYYIAPFIYMAAITLPRFSILCMYRKIFHDKYSRAGIWLVVFIMVARMIAGIPILFLQCKHLSDAWHIELVLDNCSPIIAHYTWSRVPNIIADIILLILPIPSLWRLKLAPDVRAGLIATFLLGSFGTVTAIIGFVEFFQNQLALDLSYANGGAMAWSVLEPAVYFTSACMLTYKPLIRTFVRRIVGTSILSQYSRNLGEKFTSSPVEKGGAPDAAFAKKKPSYTPPASFAPDMGPAPPAKAFELPGQRSPCLAEVNGTPSPVELANHRSARFSNPRQHSINKASISAPTIQKRPSLHLVPVESNELGGSYQSDMTQAPCCGSCLGCLNGGRCANADQALAHYLNA